MTATRFLALSMKSGRSGAAPYCELTPAQQHEAAWNTAVNRGTIEGFEEFLQGNLDSVFAEQARESIQAIKDRDKDVLSLRIGMTFPEVDRIIGASEYDRKLYADWVELAGSIPTGSATTSEFTLMFLHEFRYIIHIKNGLLAGVGTGGMDNPKWIQLGQD